MVNVKLNIEGQVGSGKTIVNSIISSALEKSNLEITEREHGSSKESFTIKGDPIFSEKNDFQIRKEKYDSKSVFAVIDQELALEALNNNILILEDPFRHGFECKACDGEGHTNVTCTFCVGNKVVAQNPEYNVGAATLSEEELKTLPPAFVEKLRSKRKEQEQQKIVSGGLTPCNKCVLMDKRGQPYISGFEPCSICKGVGASIVIPEAAMNRPTSGKVVSLGPDCRNLKVGDRVVYSNMMGHAIKLKHKDVFRIMREDEIMLRLHGTNPEKFQRKLS